MKGRFKKFLTNLGKGEAMSPNNDTLYGTKPTLKYDPNAANVAHDMESYKHCSYIKNDMGQTEDSETWGTPGNDDSTKYEQIEQRVGDVYSQGTAFAEQTDASHSAQITHLQDIALYLPSWGYTDYMVERLNWQKGLNNVGGEPGWFYFRIFFHFNTRYGLFGGILEDEMGKQLSNSNNARTYYNMWSGHYTSLGMEYRAKSLDYFVRQLNNISNKTPWFFKSISGLDKAQITSLTEPFKDNEIEIKCAEESIDMRLTTLFDYYKFACFDYVNLKEILPENLRKFDMSVVVYGVPIRYLDTHSKIKGKEYKSRTIDSLSNMMTMKMFTFKDCEFDIENMTSGINSEVSNETAFELGKGNSIKIKYKKVFNYHQNGFSNVILSDLGMFNNFNSDVASRFQKMSDAFNYMKYSSAAVGAADDFVDNYISSKTKFSKWYKFSRNAGIGSAYKVLIDETEAICQDYYNNVLNYTFNNLVGDKLLHSAEIGYIIPQDKVPGGDWFYDQIKKGKQGVQVKNTGKPKIRALYYKGSEINKGLRDNAPTLTPLNKGSKGFDWNGYYRVLKEQNKMRYGESHLEQLSGDKSNIFDDEDRMPTIIPLSKPNSDINKNNNKKPTVTPLTTFKPGNTKLPHIINKNNQNVLHRKYNLKEGPVKNLSK